MQGERPAGVAWLAVLYVVSGVLCLVGALRPMSARTPVGLLWVLAGVGLGGAGLLWLLRRRMGERGLQTAVVVVVGLLGVLAWRSVTAVGIVGLGPAMVALGQYVAHHLPPRQARAHTAILLIVATAGAAAAEPTGFAAAWVTVVATVAFLTEAQIRISGELRRAAGTDPLTGLANRRSWEVAAHRSLAHAQRSGEPLTVAVLDLDHFKVINDREGHGAGDALLRDLAVQWSARLRSADLLGRYGGDEFVLCLPDTDARHATDLLARLRAGHPASWSAGTATARPGDTLTAILARADSDLYRHKRRRRRTA